MTEYTPLNIDARTIFSYYHDQRNVGISSDLICWDSRPREITFLIRTFVRYSELRKQCADQM